jgi:hypothetical protein
MLVTVIFIMLLVVFKATILKEIKTILICLEKTVSIAFLEPWQHVTLFQKLCDAVCALKNLVLVTMITMIALSTETRLMPPQAITAYLILTTTSLTLERITVDLVLTTVTLEDSLPSLIIVILTVSWKEWVKLTHWSRR